VGMERHMDLAGHRSQPLTRTLVAESDLILAMSGQHLERIQALGGGDKGYLLTSYPALGGSGRGIVDPVGADLTVYRDTADELEEEIRRVFDRIMPATAPDDAPRAPRDR
jgi:protein-tyrosine-phosphatase